MKAARLLLPVVAILGYVSLTSYNKGSGALLGTDGSGAKGGGGCSCHDFQENSNIIMSIEVDSAGQPVSKYIPGKEYVIKLTAQNNTSFNFPKFGFRMAVVKEDNAGTSAAVNAGTIAIRKLPDNAQYDTIGNFHVVGQKSRISATRGSGKMGTIYEEKIPWIAPAAGAGDLKIFGVMLASDDNKNQTGDKWNKMALSLPEYQFPAQIKGDRNICVHGTTEFHATRQGGSWSSSDPDIARINEGTGQVTGVGEGNVTITYSINGEELTAPLSVSLMPVLEPLTGKESVCSGSSVSWGTNISGGDWKSDNSDIATVSSRGEVWGVGEGKTTITYIMNNACGSDSKKKEIIVHKSPDAGVITADASDICVGSNVVLKCTQNDGVWNTGSEFAAVSGDGTVTASREGSVTIYHSIYKNSCVAKSEKVLNFYSVPTKGTITGPWAIKVGERRNFNVSSIGGFWSMANGSNAAAITNDGEVTGLKTGKATIIYSMFNGTCLAVLRHTIEVQPK